ARADLHDMAPRAHDHDQVLRGVEKLTAFLDLLLERPLGAPRLGQAARAAADADDVARRPPDRREAERDVDRRPVLAQAHGFEPFDRLAAGDPGQIVPAMLAAVLRDNDRSGLSDRLVRRIAVEALCRRIPA